MSAHTIHHVTAVTADVSANLSFYIRVLGLRLVKRTVNQDDVRAYHLFYADAVGSPGTDMTFFDWSNIGSHRPGYASAALVSFRAPQGSLEWWGSRLAVEGCPGDRVEGALRFNDPEGQRLEIVEDQGWPVDSQPWTATVPTEFALQGILGVDLDSLRPDGTRRVLEEILGFKEAGEGAFIAEDETSRCRVRLLPTSDAVGRLGAGGVHHVAFRVQDDQELLALQAKVEALGLRTSGMIDRFWFHSLYFREPGGVLFELATLSPGFGADEAMAHLGEKLALPPFLESRRAEIEAGLKPLPDLASSPS